MKILIIENVWMGKRKYGFFDKALLTSFSILPTLYARQIAAITPRKHTVDIKNERYSQIDVTAPYDIVNINFTTSTTPRAYALADKFHQRGVPVILSGLHASALPEEAKEHADSVLIGRGELNWLMLLRDLEQGQLKPFYPPTQYTPSIHIPPTCVHLPGFVITGALEATRGCPYRCQFCQDSNIPGGSEYYERPLDEVISEIKAIPQKTIMFYDASLTINPPYTKALFRKMVGLHKKFFCNGNLDVLAQDKELVALSKKAGCVSWLIGFESVSQETLDSMRKKTNKVKEYATAVENIHRNGMAVVGCFVFGFDTDTHDVFDSTFQMIKALDIDVADFSILTPFPGTPIFTALENADRILTTDWSQYNGKNVVFKPKHMAPQELLQGTKRIYSQFYSPPYTLHRLLKSVTLGFHPFFLVLVRNVISNMNKRMFLPFPGDQN